MKLDVTENKREQKTKYYLIEKGEEYSSKKEAEAALNKRQGVKQSELFVRGEPIEPSQVFKL
jgi:hypothetical protein